MAVLVSGYTGLISVHVEEVEMHHLFYCVSLSLSGKIIPIYCLDCSPQAGKAGVLAHAHMVRGSLFIFELQGMNTV